MMSSQQAVQADECRATQYLFGARVPWWAKQRWLRLAFYLPLTVLDRNFGRWKRARVSPRRFRRLKEHLDRQYPPEVYSPRNLVGREKEFNLLLDAFRLHVLRHPVLEKLFTKEELPKAFCLSGQSGSGKTFLTMVSLKQMLLEGHSNGVLVSPVIVRGSDVYSEFYGRSTKQLGKILNQAASAPSVVYIDEFQTLGKKVRGETGTEMEDTRVQDELNRWLDKITSGSSRTLVVVATNAYEQTREDIRRRMMRIDLDSGVTREMLLALIEDSLEREGWKGVSPMEILEILEREATIRRRGSITPNDVRSVFREVKKARETPVLETLRKNLTFALPKLPVSRHKVKMEDFIAASKNMKLYSEQEKSREIMDAVYLIRPKETRQQIGGLHEIKDRILNQISLAFNPKMAELGYDSNCRFLLLGPPGTGKTLLALVAAAENNVAFIKVRGGELMSGASYHGEPERRIKELFGLARQRSPCILFLDEADAIFWGGDSTSNKLLAQIKSELSELTSKDRIVVIATSNKEELIDRATRDRFEPHVYTVPPPQDDDEWNEVVEIHLQRIKPYLAPNVEGRKITRMFRRERILSPRGVAETITEAHRLWASEIAAANEVRAATDREKRTVALARFRADLERIEQMLPAIKSDPSVLEQVHSDTYRLTLRHFELALNSLETPEDRNARELTESLILPEAMPGVAYGLYTTPHGVGGIMAVQCSVRPLVPGERQVSVTGQATSVVLGHSAVPDHSVMQSAENAVEAVRGWLWNAAGIELDEMHVHFQMRSLSEGAPGQGVSGPSAGLTMFVALVSELANVRCQASKVMTGTIGIKLDVGPVGGLGGFGTETGKLVGILKTKRIRITDLFVPRINYDKARDEMNVLSDEGIIIHPIISAQETWEPMFGLTENVILERICSRHAEQSECRKKGTITNCVPTR
jgi:SpoVK/Ycf46/Vps4 family AAA+-type ATPase